MSGLMKKHPTEEEVSLTFIGPNTSMTAALEVMRSLGFKAQAAHSLKRSRHTGVRPDESQADFFLSRALFHESRHKSPPQA